MSLTRPNLLASTAVYAAGEAIAKVMLILIMWVWIQYVSPAEFGRLEVLRSGLMVLATPLGLGLSAAAARWYFELDEGEFRRFLTSSLLAISALTLVGVALVLALPSAWGASLIADPAWRTAWLLVVISAGFSAVQTPLRSTLVVQGRAPAHSLVVVVQAVATVGIGTTLLVAFDGGVLGLLCGYLGGFASSALLAIAFSRRNLGLGWDRSLLVAGLGYGLPLLPHLLAHHVMTYADRLILVGARGEAETGLYSAAYLFASGLTVLCLALNKALLPAVFRKMGAVEDRASEQAAGADLSQAFTYWLVVNAWLATAATFASLELVPLMRPEYQPAAEIVPWVVWGAALYGVYLMPVNTLLYRKRTALISSISIGSALLNIALNFVLIPAYGGTGAAIATLVAYAVLALGIWWRAEAALGLDRRAAWGTRAAAAAGLAALCWGTLYVVDGWGVGSRIVVEALVLAASGIGVAGLLYTKARRLLA